MKALLLHEVDERGLDKLVELYIAKWNTPTNPILQREFSEYTAPELAAEVRRQFEMRKVVFPEGQIVIVDERGDTNVPVACINGFLIDSGLLIDAAYKTGHGLYSRLTKRGRFVEDMTPYHTYHNPEGDALTCYTIISDVKGGGMTLIQVVGHIFSGTVLPEGMQASEAVQAAREKYSGSARNDKRDDRIDHKRDNRKQVVPFTRLNGYHQFVQQWGGEVEEYLTEVWNYVNAARAAQNDPQRREALKQDQKYRIISQDSTFFHGRLGAQQILFPDKKPGIVYNGRPADHDSVGHNNLVVYHNRTFKTR